MTTAETSAPARTRSTVAVVGAGMAGLTCARELHEQGIPVQLFDKSRGPSGRLSTRRRDGGQWDHGAPYFEARGAAFRAQCALWEHAEVVGRWGPPGTWIGLPRMSALGRHLADGLKLQTGCRVGAVLPTEHGVRLLDTTGAELGEFARAVVAVPAPQAVPLLEAAPELQAAAQGVPMEPAYALLLELPARVPRVGPLLQLAEGPLSLLVRNAAKPDRPEGECWVAHTTAAWSLEHLEEEPASLVDELVGAFCDAVGQTVQPSRVQVHRWRFARPARRAGAWSSGFALGADGRLGVCGDWCAGTGVEAAWTSGRRLGEALRAEEERP